MGVEDPLYIASDCLWAAADIALTLVGGKIFQAAGKTAMKFGGYITQRGLKLAKLIPVVVKKAVEVVKVVAKTVAKTTTKTVEKVVKKVFVVIKIFSKSKIGFSSTQLQKKFKHAIDFGVSGNYSSKNAKLFQATLQDFVNKNPMIKNAKYRGDSAKIYLNESTGQAVVLTTDNKFWTAWKLASNQLEAFLKTGNMQ